MIYGKDAVSWDHFDPELEVFDLYAPFDEATLENMNIPALGEGDG